MQFVDKKWYQVYRLITLGCASLALFYAIASWLVIDALPVSIHRVSYFIAALAVWQIIYTLVIYPRVAAKMSYFAATLTLAMIQVVAVSGFIHTTGRVDSPFLIWWLIISLLSGCFGIVGTAGTALITVSYFIFNSTDQVGNTEYSAMSVSLLVALLVASYISQRVWKRFYIDGSSEQVAALSGQLKTNQKQSEILVQSLTDGVILVDTAGVITLMNPAAATMTGWTIEDGTGSDSKLVVALKAEDGSDLSVDVNPLHTIISQPKNTTQTYQLVSRDNRQLIVSIVTSPVLTKTQEVAGGVIVIRDISVTHQSDKQRAEFISTASHEMRTPVAAIEGYLQLALNEKVAKIDTKAREYLEKALDSTHHLGKLFQDLLTSAKAEDGRLVSHPQVVELGQYIEEVAETFKFSAEKKGLLTDFIFGKNSDNSHVLKPLYYVLVDPDRLREVITNLFDNAVKYTPTGKISVGLTGNNEVVQMFVKDTGPGIAPEDLPHLFQKFYRVDNSATRTIGGTGLGLFICKRIIDMYRGRIWVESTVNQGSTFYINLPRLTPQQAQEIKNGEAMTASTPISSLTTPV